MAKKRPVRKSRPTVRRITQSDLAHLVAAVEASMESTQRNANAIERLERMCEVQLRRCGEMQHEIDEIQKRLPKA